MTDVAVWVENLGKLYPSTTNLWFALRAGHIGRPSTANLQSALMAGAGERHDTPSVTNLRFALRASLRDALMGLLPRIRNYSALLRSCLSRSKREGRRGFEGGACPERSRRIAALEPPISPLFQTRGAAQANSLSSYIKSRPSADDWPYQFEETRATITRFYRRQEWHT